MCVDGAVDVELVGVAFSLSCEFLSFLTPFASDVKLEDDGVVVARNGSVGVNDFTRLLEDVLLGRIVLGRALLEPLHPAETFARAGEGNETDTVAENLVLDDGSVVVDKDVFYGQSRDFGQHDTAVCVCDRGIDADEREDRVILVILVEVYLEFLEGWLEIDAVGVGIGRMYLFEGVEVPRVVLAGVVARKIGRNDI